MPGYAEPVVAVPAWLTRTWRRVEQFAGGRAALPTLFAVALAVYGIVSIALPLGAGRDLGRYLIVYAQLFGGDVVYPHALVSRTPGTPLVAGPLLELGPAVAEVGASILYALSIVAWYSAARRFGPAAAIATAVALLLYPGYVLLFHQLSSDAVYAAGFAGFAVLVARALERPGTDRAAALGAGVAGLVLIRPVSQILFVLALVPLLSARGWPRRVGSAAAFAAAAALPLATLAAHNYVRADDFTIVRGGGASVPLFRAFVADRTVEPENGPASRELARAVARNLLPNEPYRSYGIDLRRFFSSGSARMHEDLIGLSDRTWGWDDDYARLGRVGREAVLAHPWTYARGVAGDIRKLVVWPLYVGVSDSSGGNGEGMRALVAEITPNQKKLPQPSEGEPIPAAYQSAYISTPDGRIREVWTSPTEHQVVFRDASDRVRAAELDRRVGELTASFSDRGQRPELVRRLNSASRWYPRPVVWLIVGLFAAILRRPRRIAVPLVLTGSALLILVATALAVYAVAEYSVPVAPAFVLLATVGALGRRATRPSGRTPEHGRLRSRVGRA
jgi:hypothetical protein